MVYLGELFSRHHTMKQLYRRSIKHYDESGGETSTTETKQPETPTTPVETKEQVKTLAQNQEKEVLKAVGNKEKKEATKEVDQLEDSKQVLPTDSQVLVIRKDAQGKMQLFLAERQIYQSEEKAKPIPKDPKNPNAPKKEAPGKAWMLSRDFMSVTMFSPFKNAEGKADATTSKIENLKVEKGDIIFSYNMLTDDKYRQKSMEISNDTANDLKSFGKENSKDWWSKLMSFTEVGKDGKSWFQRMFGEETGNFFQGIADIFKTFWFGPKDAELPSTLQDPQGVFVKKQIEAKKAIEQLKAVFAETNGGEEAKTASTTEAGTQPTQAEAQKRSPNTTNKEKQMNIKGAAKTPEQQKEFLATRTLLENKIAEFAKTSSSMTDIIAQVQDFIRDNSGNKDLKYYFDTWTKRVSHPEAKLTEAEDKLISSYGVLENERTSLAGLAKNTKVKKAETPMKNTYAHVTALTHQPYALVLHTTSEVKDNGTRSFHAVIKKDGTLELHYASGDMVDGFTRDDAVEALNKANDTLQDVSKDAQVRGNNVVSKYYNNTKHDLYLQFSKDYNNKTKEQEEFLNVSNIFKNMPAKNRGLINGLNYHVAIENPQGDKGAMAKQKEALKALDTHFGMVNPGTGSGPRHIMIGSLKTWNTPEVKTPEQPVQEKKAEAAPEVVAP